jgi:hypothetical protein
VNVDDVLFRLCIRESQQVGKHRNQTHLENIPDNPYAGLSQRSMGLSWIKSK